MTQSWRSGGRRRAGKAGVRRRGGRAGQHRRPPRRATREPVHDSTRTRRQPGAETPAACLTCPSERPYDFPSVRYRGKLSLCVCVRPARLSHRGRCSSPRCRADLRAGPAAARRQGEKKQPAKMEQAQRLEAQALIALVDDFANGKPPAEPAPGEVGAEPFHQGAGRQDLRAVHARDRARRAHDARRRRLPARRREGLAGRCAAASAGATRRRTTRRARRSRRRSMRSRICSSWTCRPPPRDSRSGSAARSPWRRAITTSTSR